MGEVKPCPHCAGNARIKTTRHQHPPSHWVACNECEAASGAYASRAAAIAAWNTRPATDTAGDALREALAAAYAKGAMDVHTYWIDHPGEAPRGDPEFGEAASDYAASALALFDSAALSQPSPDDSLGRLKEEIYLEALTAIEQSGIDRAVKWAGMNAHDIARHAKREALALSTNSTTTGTRGG